MYSNDNLRACGRDRGRAESRGKANGHREPTAARRRGGRAEHSAYRVGVTVHPMDHGPGARPGSEAA